MCGEGEGENRLKGAGGVYVGPHAEQQRIEPEFRRRSLGIGQGNVKSSEFPVRHTDTPLGTPINHARGILPTQFGPSRKMWIIEGDIQRRGLSGLALNVDVLRLVMSDAKHVVRLVEHEAGLVEILAAAQWNSIDGYKLGHEVQTKHIAGVRVEGRIGNGTFAIADSGHNGA